MRKKTEFRVGEHVHYSVPVAGRPHFGGGRIIKVVPIRGGQLLTMDWDAHGWRLELDTTDPEHYVFRPAKVSSDPVITLSGISYEVPEEHYL